MNRSARSVLRKIGTDHHLEEERQQRAEREMEETQKGQQEGGKAGDSTGLGDVPDEMLTETEKRHEQYRRRQAMGGRFTPAAERLPIMTTDERQERDKNRPKWQQSQFEGPIEKLIEKYQDLEEVKKHLSLGQAMKYEFTEDGKVLDRDGNIIYDREKLHGNS